MHINIDGHGTKKVKPNEIVLQLEFLSKSKNYDEAFDEGTKSVNEFINNILIPNGYKKEDLVTKNFSITNVDEYNPSTNKMQFSHYLYKQEGEFKVDYNLDKLASLLTQISNLEKPPVMKVYFTNSDTENYKNEALKLAYNNALERAKAIASASGKSIKETIKVDYKPEITPLRSQTMFDQNILKLSEASPQAVATVGNIFTPSDIEIKENIYVLFLAE